MRKTMVLLTMIVLVVFSVFSAYASVSDEGKMLGDVNGDNSVAVVDATLTQRNVAKIESFSEDQFFCADTNGDGEISVVDATIIQRYVAKIIDKFPAEENGTQTPTEEPTQVPTDAPTDEPTESETQAPSQEATPSEYELEVLRLVNIEREKVGAQPLEFGYFIYDCAKLRAKECDSYFSHTRPDGTMFFTVFEELGVEEFFSALGENIAWGHRTPEQVMESWMNSEGHRANILDESYDYVAIGTFECTEQPGTYATVQLFWGAW